MEPAVDDRLARAIGIPAFGIAIPFLFGLYGPIGPAEPLFWAGAVSFLALSAAIWHGNRWLLFRQRRLDWLHHPRQKVALLLLGIVAFTAPLTVAWITGWYRLTARAVDEDTVRAVTLMNVICVVFVAHVYETVLLVRDRAQDLVRVERLERARIQAELAALRAQVDPHFMFNCLNTLGHLIEQHPADAVRFNSDLAHVYRFCLHSTQHDLVPLDEELAFVERYGALLEIRFGAALVLSITRHEGVPASGWAVPPTAVQSLVENAVKHTSFSMREPLVIRIEVGEDAVVVTSPLRPRADAPTSAGTGLQNLAERVRLASGRALAIERTGDQFIVKVPLVSVPDEDAA